MSDQLIRALIETRVRDWAEDNDLPVEWENDDFTAPVTAYARFNLLPAQTRSDDLEGTLRTWLGVAQIAICTPGGQGTAASNTLLADLAARFPVNLRIDSDPAVDGIALTVVVMTPLSIPQGFADAGKWTVPAYFQYRSDYVVTDVADSSPFGSFTLDSTLVSLDSTFISLDQV